MKSTAARTRASAFLEDRGEYVITYTGYSARSARASASRRRRTFVSVERFGLGRLRRTTKTPASSRARSRQVLYAAPARARLHGAHLAGREHGPHSLGQALDDHRGDAAGPGGTARRSAAARPPSRPPDGWLDHLPRRPADLARPDLPRRHRPARSGRPAQGHPAPSPLGLRPQRPTYESGGLIPGVVFPTGAIVEGDDIRLYYGAADTRIGLARGKVSTLLRALREAGK